MAPAVYVFDTATCRSISHTITGLVCESFVEFAAKDAVEEEDDTISELVGFHDDTACLWLVLCEGDVARGMAMLAQYHDSMYISSLCVSPTYRGGGGGSLLLRSASALAASLGLMKLSGSVDAEAASLRSFYTRLGAQHAAASQLCSAGAVAHSVRLEAPSGPATNGGVAVPGPIPEVLAKAWRQRQVDTPARGVGLADFRTADRERA
jgi:GNAT superfamily N-acetyltransferase